MVDGPVLAQARQILRREPAEALIRQPVEIDDQLGLGVQLHLLEAHARRQLAQHQGRPRTTSMTARSVMIRCTQRRPVSGSVALVDDLGARRRASGAPS